MTRSDARILLGLPESARAADAREAYRRCVLVVHPDRVDRSREPEVWAAASELLRRFNEAYAALQKGRLSEFDELWGDAATVIVRAGQGSVSLLQRKLSVGVHAGGPAHGRARGGRRGGAFRGERGAGGAHRRARAPRAAAPARLRLRERAESARVAH